MLIKHLEPGTKECLKALALSRKLKVSHSQDVMLTSIGSVLRPVFCGYGEEERPDMSTWSH